MFDYFYGAQAEQFAFYRVPKVLFTNDRFKYLSAEAKTLYGILLDRVPLSAKNGWLDEQGRVYIICTIEEIMEDMNCGNKKAIQLLSDLEDKVGLIERKRQGLGKPNLIYVKNFISVDSPVERHFLKCQNDTSGSVEITSLEVSKGHGNKTDINQFGKGVWMKLPEDGTTRLSRSVKTCMDETGRSIWGRETREVTNTELKALMESYKDKTRGSVLSDLSDRKEETAAVRPSGQASRKQEAAR